MRTNAELGLVHTSATLVPIFEQLCKASLPGVSVFNLVDDSLIKDVIAHGRIAPADGPPRRAARRRRRGRRRRFYPGHVFVDRPGRGNGGDAWRPCRCCESISRWPIMRSASARRIGVIATLPTTLEPTADLIRRRAAAAGKQIELTSHLCDRRV